MKQNRITDQYVDKRLFAHMCVRKKMGGIFWKTEPIYLLLIKYCIEYIFIKYLSWKYGLEVKLKFPRDNILLFAIEKRS